MLPLFHKQQTPEDHGHHFFTDPVNGNMEWREIETLLVAVGCRVLEGNGFPVTFEKGMASAPPSTVPTQIRPRSGIG